MTYAVGAIAVLLLGAVQVSVVPLFPIAGAEADVGLIAILATAMVAGPRPAMLATPALALAIGLSSSRSPGLMLVGYAAILPLAAFLEDLPYPLGRLSRLLAVAIVAGLWGRFLLGMAAISAGGEFAINDLLLQVLIPGIVFDALLFLAIFVAFQLAGVGNRRFSLQRSGWLP